MATQDQSTLNNNLDTALNQLHGGKMDESQVTDLLDSILAVGTANREALSANKSVSEDASPIQSLDPGGSNRTVTLPSASTHQFFVIGNRAGAAENLTVENSSNTTLNTLNQDDVGLYFYDGNSWMTIQTAGTVN